MKYTPKKIEWFIKRIGRTVFRDRTDCCHKCDQVARDGIFIADKQQAEYMAMVDTDFACEGIHLNYRDVK